MPFEPRYLIPESVNQFKHLFVHHPVLVSLSVLALYAAILNNLRLRYKRMDADVLLFALILWAVGVLIGSVVYTLTHVKGFHFGV